MPPPSWTPPHEFEEYRLVRRLGHGSMGQVWLAHDLLLDRRVAIKFIGSLTEGTSARERFLNEARAIAKLSHPNVVTVHRIGSSADQPFMVSELVEGQSLDQLARPVPSETLLRLSTELARGLAAAHRAGILHRDLKPANAMLTRDGVAKLLDFGLAKFGPEQAPRPEATRAVGNDAEAADPSATVASAPRAAAATEQRSPALTADGSILGTPLYMAPECWRGEQATRRSDVYSLGALLYELASGQPPVRFLPAGPIAEQVCSLDARRLSEVAPGVDPTLAALVDRCLQRDPELRPSGGDELREGLEALSTAGANRAPPPTPYRGLSAFEGEHRGVFFGRAEEVRAACDRLRAQSLVVVAGESGVGKSSLCRAGVLPAVGAGELGGGRSWATVSSLPGKSPYQALISACAAAVSLPEELLIDRLGKEPGALGRQLQRALGDSRGLVIFVDQLEEWVTFADPLEAARAATALSSACEGFPGLRVLATARTDLLSRLAALPLLGAQLSTALLLLGPVQRAHLHQVVVGPAEALGVRFETEAMVNELVALASEGGSLPLLQFALARLWETRGDKPVLTASSLSALGGAAGALAAHADGVLASLPADQLEAAQPLLVALVSTQDTRRRRPERELVHRAADGAALSTLSRARLVVARDSPEGTVWELAHEALLREWPTLRRWLLEDVDARAWRERLGSATQEWLRLSRANEALWGDRVLAEGRHVLRRLADTEPTLPIEHRAFLASSWRAQRLRRIRRPLIAAAVLVMVAGTAAAVRLTQLAEVDRAAADHLIRADSHAASAEKSHQRFDTARHDAYARFDEGDWGLGEQRWTEALAEREAWERALALTRAEIDAAQLLAPRHEGLRARLLTWVEGSIAADEAAGRTSELDAEVTRLENLGAPAEDLAKLHADAQLELSVTPSNATLLFERYDDLQTRARRTVLPVASALAPGSYRLTIRAPGKAETVMPFVAARGEHVALSVTLIDEAAVPIGYRYIPAGRSLLGSAADESVRREFYEAAPLHAVQVAAFFMAQHEVTFGDWLTYLDALPEAERAIRTPRIDSSLGTADTANLRLERSPEGWKLRFKPVTQRYEAAWGQPLIYAERDRRASQDWRRMPVVGVSPLDAEAYAAWLDRTGRVPGARLCTEHEWERAARGADGRTLPHGELMSADDANIDETYGRRDAAFGPDEVGSHPASRSPFEVDDLIGNVWEIVRPTSRTRQWANKGGSWQVNTLSARLPNQWVLNPGYRQVETGVRVCASVR